MTGTFDPVFAAFFADVILLLHLAVVAFVVLGEALILAGGCRAWAWVRHRGLRLGHAALMAFIALQTWFGQLCPLTVWEQELRSAAGQTAFEASFIEHWLSRLLYIEAPWWAFVAGYTGFALLVLATWRWVPPRARAQRLPVGDLT